MLKIDKSNALEYYLMTLISVGLPAIAYVYLDWRAALTVFVLSQLTIGILAFRSRDPKSIENVDEDTLEVAE